MYKKCRLSQAITLAIASGALGVASNALAQDQSSLMLEEVIVTATKRAENLQDIPVAVQALSEETLDDLGINNFTDYVTHLPNVSFAGRGPGQNDVFIRGVSTSKGSLFQAGGIGAGPTVAIYVDEAPITAAGRNLDVYVTDMARIEVLPGPQGTLYGASSQAGTIRYITNKPDASGFDLGFDLTGSTIRHGEETYGVEGFINIPIIQDRLAVRVSAYSVDYGGYIDNVRGTISFEESSRIINKDETDIFGVADNADQVEDDFNDTSYTGGRVSVLFDINDDWNLQVGFMTQDLESDGVFDFSPDVGDLEVQRFSPDRLNDEFDQYNWRLQGRIGWLDVVYAGSFLERDVEQNIDYVGYTLEGGFQPWYNCTYSSADFSTLEFDINECAAPAQRYHGISHSENQQHELRFSGDVGDSLQFTVGVWYEDSDGGVSQNWLYHSPGNLPGGVEGIAFAPNAPHSQANAFFDPTTRDPEVAFFNDLVPKTDQIAGFGEVTWHITDKWSVTGGVRRYKIDSEVAGSFNFASFGTVDKDSGGTLNDVEPETEKDTIFKGTLTYKPNDDILLYATFSEGFRRGGFNRQGDIINRTTGEFEFPAFYHSDTIDNYEFGWKTVLLDGRLRFNGSAYFIDWSDVQIDIFDQTVNRLLFTANAGEAEVLGVEGDFTFMATDHWMFSGAFSINDTELTDRPEGANNLVPVGTDLSLTPTFQGNLYARYDFDLVGKRSYAQLGANHRGSTHTSVVVGQDFPLDSYTMLDFAFGMNLDNWDVQLFVNNLTDKRAQLFISDQDDIARTVVSRPRTVGLRLSYDY